eukprot:363361-Chlamydomonas_euryale.AAC.6
MVPSFVHSWFPVPDRGDSPAHAHPPRDDAHAPHVARLPCGSLVKQLLLAEGLVGLGGVVGRPFSYWQHRAFAALSPALSPPFAGLGLVWGGSGPRAVAFPL